MQAREIRRPWSNDRNVWASVSVFPELPVGQRGSECQIRRVPGLVADLDITTEGIKEDGRLESLRDCYEVALSASEALGALPAIGILSPDAPMNCDG